MIAVIAGVALVVTPLLLVRLRMHPQPMRALAIAACALPFLFPLELPLLRASAAVATWVFLIRTLEYTHDHEKPLHFGDFLLSMLIPAVIRWDTPRRVDAPRLKLTALTALMQVSIALALLFVLYTLEPSDARALVVTQFGIYFGIAGLCNLFVLPIAYRGVDYDDPFNNPLMSRTPGEFWGKRWNTWVNHLLYRYIFMPAGGRRHPVRGTLAAFAFSGLFHEAIVFVGTMRLSGWMFAFFILQGVIVVATQRGFRHLARRAPWLSWALTVLIMLSTGVMFVRGAAGIDPTETWNRYAESPQGLNFP